MIIMKEPLYIDCHTSKIKVTTSENSENSEQNKQTATGAKKLNARIQVASG